MTDPPTAFLEELTEQFWVFMVYRCVCFQTTFCSNGRISKEHYISAKGLTHRRVHVVMDGASRRVTFVEDLLCKYIPYLSCHLVAVSAVVFCARRTAEFSGISAVVKGPGGQGLKDSGQVVLCIHSDNRLCVADTVVMCAAPSCSYCGQKWTICSQHNDLDSDHSPSASKVSAAYTRECGQGTVFGERLNSVDKNSDTMFQCRSSYPVLDSRSYTIHCFGREGGAVKRPATVSFVEKVVVREGGGLDGYVCSSIQPNFHPHVSGCCCPSASSVLSIYFGYVLVVHSIAYSNLV